MLWVSFSILFPWSFGKCFVNISRTIIFIGSVEQSIFAFSYHLGIALIEKQESCFHFIYPFTLQLSLPVRKVVCDREKTPRKYVLALLSRREYQNQGKKPNTFLSLPFFSNWHRQFSFPFFRAEGKKESQQRTCFLLFRSRFFCPWTWGSSIYGEETFFPYFFGQGKGDLFTLCYCTEEGGSPVQTLPPRDSSKALEKEKEQTLFKDLRHWQHIVIEKNLSKVLYI